MNDRNRRLKAQDVFNNTNFFLGKTTDFSKAFPSVESIRVLVDEEGEGVDEHNASRQYKNPAECIDCSNPLCYDGGVRIGQIIRQMIAAGKKEYENTVRCQGYEGSPKGRKKYGPCDNEFTLKISIVMKDKS